MIIKILHRIWNERRQNMWLFLELIVASLFLWLAIDPLFTLVCRNNLPKGYEVENLYCVEFNSYNIYESKYRKGMTSDKLQNEFLLNIAKTFENIPEIECSFIGESNLKPNCLSTNNMMIWNDQKDSLKYDARFYRIETNKYSRFFETWRVRDANSGKILQQDDNTINENVYLSRRKAMELFGTTDVVGKTVSYSHKENIKILGVFEDLQLLSYDEYTPLVLICNKSNYGNNIWNSISFRLKKEVDEDSFKKKFETEIAPKLNHANYYITGIKPYRGIIQEYDERYGITNKYRLYAGLSGFALFCAFMGVFSAFWIRTNNRRRDIGIMRSVGASAGNIVGQFVTETLILVTAAFILALPFIMHYIYAEGFAEPLAKVPTWIRNEQPDQSYLHNRPILHFAIVTAVAYLFISTIAVAGALLPSVRTTRTLPSDALRK